MKPNILFITCDQLRLDALGCYGNSIIRTPNIDRLAKEGAKFVSMYVAAPICAPNRASIATGRYPSIHGLRVNGRPLPKSETTLMETLRMAGYATWGVGKMHFEPQWGYEPGDSDSLVNAVNGAGALNPQPKPWELPFYGFEKVWLTEDHREGPYADYLRSQGFDPWADPHSFTFPQSIAQASVYPKEHHQTTWIGDRSRELINGHNNDRPFFLWTSFVAPHHPFTAAVPYDSMYNPADMPLPKWSPDEMEKWPEKYVKDFYAKNTSHEAVGLCDFVDDDWRRIKAFYYGMVTHIDDEVGRILDTLEERNLLDNTIIVFTSDHGELLGDHRLLFKKAPYESVIGVPFLMHFPDKIKAGGSIEGLCSSIDIMPTLLDYAGVSVPKGVQGKSMRCMIEKDEECLRSAVLVELTDHVRVVRTPTASLTWNGFGKRGELYDLQSDPEQFHNLWDEPASKPLREELTDRLIEAMAMNVDPFSAKITVC